MCGCAVHVPVAKSTRYTSDERSDMPSPPMRRICPAALCPSSTTIADERAVPGSDKGGRFVNSPLSSSSDDSVSTLEVTSNIDDVLPPRTTMLPLTAPQICSTRETNKSGMRSRVRRVRWRLEERRGVETGSGGDAVETCGTSHKTSRWTRVLRGEGLHRRGRWD